MFKIKKTFFFILIFLVFLIFFHCKKIQPSIPLGELVYQSDCLTSKSFVKNIKPLNAQKSRYEIIQYEYSNDTLKITHLNGAFNCCPGTIKANILVENTQIHIKESEEQAVCRCICLYKINYQITNLIKGKYNLILSSPYIPNRNNTLTCTINILKNQKGEIKFPRNSYPWSY